MPMYAGTNPPECSPTDRFEDGIGWFAHPNEDGQRTSHAFRGDDGVWIIDPLDAPGVDDLLTDLGEVVGVAVLSDYHARDAARFADRYDVPVHVPRWMNRTRSHIEAPIEQFAWSLSDSGFAIQRFAPLPGWNEAIAYRTSDRTL